MPNTPPFTPLNPELDSTSEPRYQSRARSDSDYNRFAQRLEMRYTGIKDWLSMPKANGKKNSATSMSFRTSTKKYLWIKTPTRWVKNIALALTWYPTDEIKFCQAVLSQNRALR